MHVGINQYKHTVDRDSQAWRFNIDISIYMPTDKLIFHKSISSSIISDFKLCLKAALRNNSNNTVRKLSTPLYWISVVCDHLQSQASTLMPMLSMQIE